MSVYIRASACLVYCSSIFLCEMEGEKEKLLSGYDAVSSRVAETRKDVVWSDTEVYLLSRRDVER